MLAKFLKKEKKRIIQEEAGENTPTPSSFLGQFMQVVDPEELIKQQKREEEEERKKQEQEKEKIQKLKKFQKQFLKDQRVESLNSQTAISDDSDILESIQEDIDKPLYGGILMRNDKNIRDKVYRRSSKLISLSPLKRPSENAPPGSFMESSNYKSYNDISNTKNSEQSPLKSNKFRIFKQSCESPTKITEQQKQHIHNLIRKSQDYKPLKEKQQKVNQEYQFQCGNVVINKGNQKLIQNIQNDTPGTRQRQKKLLARLNNEEEDSNNHQSKSVNSYDKDFKNKAVNFINFSPQRYNSVKRSYNNTPTRSQNQFYATNTLATLQSNMLTSSASPLKMQKNQSNNTTGKNFYERFNLGMGKTKSTSNLLNNTNYNNNKLMSSFNNKKQISKDFPSFFEINNKNIQNKNNDKNSIQLQFINTSNNLGFYYKNKAGQKQGLNNRITFQEFKEVVKESKNQLKYNQKMNQYFPISKNNNSGLIQSGK